VVKRALTWPDLPSSQYPRLAASTSDQSPQSQPQVWEPILKVIGAWPGFPDSCGWLIMPR